MDLNDLKGLPIQELINMAHSMKLEFIAGIRRQELIFLILQSKADSNEIITGSGVLEVLPDGFGFLRSSDYNYLPAPDDVYVSPAQIRKFSLRTGDTVSGEIRPPREGERYFALLKVSELNFDPVDSHKGKIAFESFTALFPTRWLRLETGPKILGSRMIDLFCPIGYGQRALIQAAPKAGKTVLLKQIANAITENHPDAYLIILLVDERPEEVTDMRRSVNAEVVSSTFDEQAIRHIQVAEMVIEKAKRLVEHNRDVIILLDSITRLARAYNAVAPASGKVLTGGVDSGALIKPKQFFGAARDCEEGGSLTIVGTALVETGSKMDDVINEEFKGTGNLDLYLDRRLAENRVFPAMDLFRTGTRQYERFVPKEDVDKVKIIFHHFLNLPDVKPKATERILEKLRETKSNEELFDMIKSV